MVALVFDFDDTLAPDSTSRFLQEHGIDPRKFWSEDARHLVESGYDPALAMLRLFLERIGDGKPFGRLSRSNLREFGSTLDATFFTGLPGMFDEIRDQVRKDFRDIYVEFYIVSGGLQDILDGSEIVREHFEAVFACRLDEDEAGVLRHIKRCVTFTEKTRYLFEINKGLSPEETQKNPVLVNTDIPEPDRRVPFTNMIYVGDGLTDVPCFSLLKKSGGYGFGVFDPSKPTSAKQALQEFLRPDRVISMHAPKYGAEDELGAILRAAVQTVCTNIVLKRQAAAG